MVDIVNPQESVIYNRRPWALCATAATRPAWGMGQHACVCRMIRQESLLETEGRGTTGGSEGEVNTGVKWQGEPRGMKGQVAGELRSRRSEAEGAS